MSADRPLAPCRVFHAVNGALVAGAGQPIPEDVPLRYEDPTLAPAGNQQAAPVPPPPEPEPRTSKRGTKVRTRHQPPAENRADS